MKYITNKRTAVYRDTPVLDMMAGGLGEIVGTLEKGTIVEVIKLTEGGRGIVATPLLSIGGGTFIVAYDADKYLGGDKPVNIKQKIFFSQPIVQVTTVVLAVLVLGFIVSITIKK